MERPESCTQSFLTMLQKPFFQLLDSSLRETVPALPVKRHGDWSTSSRRAYASPNQVGSGDGPFIDVVDEQWEGSLDASVEFSEISFLATADEIYWSKSPLIATSLPFQISLTAYADYNPASATFSAGIGPGIPVAGAAHLREICTLGPPLLSTGRVVTLAETQESTVLAVLLPRTHLKVGRNRLWRLREDFAKPLPPMVREVLTRRRAGVIRAEMENLQTK